MTEHCIIKEWAFCKAYSQSDFLFVWLVGSCFYHCNIRGMNGQIIGFLPSPVFQDMPAQSPDFQSASAATNDTAFRYHSAKLCPVVGWWSWYRGCRLLREWYYQVRKQHINEQSWYLMQAFSLLPIASHYSSLQIHLLQKWGDFLWESLCKCK